MKNQLSNDWIVKRLDEVATVTMGQSPPSSSYNAEGAGVPFLQGKPPVVNAMGAAVPNQWTTEPTRVVEAGTALMTVRAPVGELFTINNSVCLGRGLAGIRAKKDVSQDYLNYYLQFSKNQFTSVSQGSTFTAINSGDLKAIQIALPAYKNQEYYGKVFTSIDQQISKTDQIIQKTELLKKGVIKELFVEESITWKTQKLGEATHFIDYRGKTPKKTEYGIPLITAKNVRMGYVDPEPREFIQADNYETWMTRGIPKKGDVLFTTEAPLGNVAQLGLTEKVAFAQRIIIIQPKEDLDSTYLKYLLISNALQEKIASLATGGTVKGIKAKVLKQIDIPIPPMDVQIKVANILSCIDSKVAIEKANKRQLLILKKGLMDDIFNGKVEVN